MQCKIHTPATITNRISWTGERWKFIPLLFPPPQIRDRKIAGFNFCAASSLVLGGGGGGGGWLAVPFSSVQDCSQDYLVGWVVRGKICIGQ